jgi:hypothetical protein
MIRISRVICPIWWRCVKTTVGSTGKGFHPRRILAFIP